MLYQETVYIQPALHFLPTSPVALLLLTAFHLDLLLKPVTVWQLLRYPMDSLAVLERLQLAILSLDLLPLLFHTVLAPFLLWGSS